MFGKQQVKSKSQTNLGCEASLPKLEPLNKLSIWINSMGSWGILLLLNSYSAAAQTNPPLTPQPREPIKPETLPPAENPVELPLSNPPLPAEVIDIPGTIVVQQFVFVGNTALSGVELSRAIAEFTNKPISFAQLVQAANQITQLYVEQGYITSGAYVPVQNLRSGKVKLQIVEGSLADIEVNIVKGRLKPNYIRRRLIKATGTPLNINQLQSALQLLQRNPLIDSLDGELSAGTKPGTNFLTVDVRGADTFKVEVELNNNRNPSIGSFERSLELTEANLLGLGDGLSLSYSNTDGSNQFQGKYTLPINASNGTLGFNLRVAGNKIVESPGDEADIEIDSRDFDLTWRQPVIQTETAAVSRELALDLTASRRESDGSILDIKQPISPGANDRGETRTSALHFGQEWLQRNRQQVLSARSQFNLGLDVFDATIDVDEPNSQFFAWRGQFLYLRQLNTPQGTPAIGSTILLRSDLQLAADALIPVEQFSLGGNATVRGYRQDALLTDNGWFASAEVRIPFARLPKFEGTLQFTPFVDFGIGWNTDSEATDFNTLIGTGIGLLWDMENRLTARVDWGVPLVNANFDKGTVQESGVYLQFNYQL